MSESPEKIAIETESPNEAVLAALKEIIPGAVADGVIDAHRIAEATGLDVAGIKDGPERFGLMWAGKSKAVEALQVPSMAALVPDMENSIDWDTAENIFIEGDNLEVLKLLQKAYNDQVKLIYIDPPYNTGNDFVYNDDFSQPLKHYLEVTGQVDAEGNRLVANTEVSGRKHSNWLSMMYPRLVLARNMLSEDGMIAVSIDDNEAANLKMLLDEIFGGENFIEQLIWNSRGGGQDTKDLVLQHEYILMYSRDKSKLQVGSKEMEAGAFPLHDPVSGRNYKRQLARKWGSNSRRSDRPNLFYPVVAPDGSNAYPMRGIADEGRWRWSQDRFVAELEAGNIEFQLSDDLGWIAYQRIWEPTDGVKKVPFGTIIPPETVGNTSRGTADLKNILGKSLFDYPKPVSLMKHLLDIADVKGNEIVLDFFAGSGTMGQAVIERNIERMLNTKFLLVTLNESTREDSIAKEEGFNSISEITRLRLRNTVENSSELISFGLRCLKLSESSFMKFSNENLNHLQFSENTLIAGSSINQVASEAFLKSGTLMSSNWRRVKVLESPAVISGGICYLHSIDLEQKHVEEMLSLPEIHTVIFLEDGFASKDALKANAVMSFKQANKIMKTI